MFKILCLSLIALSLRIQGTGHEPSKQSKEQFRHFTLPIIQQAKALACAHKNDKNSPIPVVGIAGCSAAGKTNFSRKLAKLLREEGIRVAIFHQDNFNEPRWIVNKDSELHPYFDYRRLQAIMPRIIAGEEHVEHPAYETETKWHPVKEEVTACFHNIDLIIFEGTYTLCDAKTYDLLKYSALRIFLDAPEPAIIAWNWSREQQSHHPRPREKFDADIAKDMRDYNLVILPSKQHAHFVIYKDAEHNFLELVLQQIQSY